MSVNLTPQKTAISPESVGKTDTRNAAGLSVSGKTDVQPYRPSNSTDGCAFEAKFCARCEAGREWREHERNACDIQCRALAFGIEDDGYPSEWIEEESGPRCTAFREEGSPAQEQIDSDRARYEAALAEMRAAQTQRTADND